MAATQDDSGQDDLPKMSIRMEKRADGALLVKQFTSLEWYKT